MPDRSGWRAAVAAVAVVAVVAVVVPGAAAATSPAAIGGARLSGHGVLVNYPPGSAVRLPDVRASALVRPLAPAAPHHRPGPRSRRGRLVRRAGAGVGVGVTSGRPARIRSPRALRGSPRPDSVACR